MSAATPPHPTSSFAALTRLLRYARAHRGRVVLATILSTLNKLFDIAPEILIGVAIDVVVNREASFVARFGFDTPHSQIYALAVLTFFIWVGESISEYGYQIVWRNLAQRLQADLRLHSYSHVQELDMAFFDGRSSGELVAIMNDDINQLERFLDGGANGMIQILVAVVSVGAVFFFISPLIAVLAFTPVPVILWGAFVFERKSSPLYATVRAQVGAIATRLTNNLSGMATIKSFTAEARETERLRVESEAYVDANRKAIAVSSAFIPVVRMAILTGFLFTLVVGGVLALNGTLNVGAYGVLVFLTQRLLWPLTGMAQIIDQYARAMASTQRVLDLIEMPIGVQDTGTRALPRPVHGAVRIEDLSFRYKNTSAGAINGVSIDVPGGTTLALVGTTGAGKSTLMKLLLRYYQPDAGRISIDGIDIRDLTLAELRGAIGFVAQDVFLFEGTVAENIRYGRPEAGEAEVIAAAKAAEAWEFVEKLSQGLHTTVGERGVRLSGGQRQRISLARALLKNPPILILDEATSSVDNETEAAIQRSLHRIAHDRTVFVIAHRLSTIVDADQIAVLDAGRVVELGTHAQLLTRAGAYAAQWRVQTGGAAESARAAE